MPNGCFKGIDWNKAEPRKPPQGGQRSCAGSKIFDVQDVLSATTRDSSQRSILN